jgi:hypothetical protein
MYSNKYPWQNLAAKIKSYQIQNDFQRHKEYLYLTQKSISIVANIPALSV